MKIYYPEYYPNFQCSAAACPDSCCKDWTVDVDPQSAQAYRALSGPLGDRLRQVVQDTDNGTVMTIENGRCPMWRQDSLCRIHAELGHDALCQTCRDFPRLRHDYGNFVELGLELSCPEAARLILTAKEHPVLCETQPGGEIPDYDLDIMDILLESREETLSFLDNSPYSIPETLAIILLHSHSVQSQLDGAEPTPFDPEACLNEAKEHITAGDIASIFHFFLQLEILTDDWRARLNSAPGEVQWTDPLRKLMRYMLQRYWLQAIADYDLVCRVKLAVTACLLVGALGDDTFRSAQQFSKEIENDPDNVEALLDGAYTSPAFTDVNLLSLLLA